MSDLKIKELELEIEKIKHGIVVPPKEKRQFSIGWFIFWLIVFWPIALIMVVWHLVSKD